MWIKWRKAKKRSWIRGNKEKMMRNDEKISSNELKWTKVVGKNDKNDETCNIADEVKGK